MTSEKHLRYLIIGAGPTGLAAAWKLGQAGESDLLVVERNSWPGGLSASFWDDKGFLWDLGGHVIHSHYPQYDELLKELIPPEGWCEHLRQAWIYLRDSRAPYPFQLHLDRLPEAARKRCVEGLKTARGSAGKKADNFHDWIITRFGDGIAELFMEPYNRKQWGMPTREMGTYWLNDRVALPSEDSPKKTGRPKPWGPNASFIFPRRGGTGAIWQALADRLGGGLIRYGCEIMRIDAEKHRAVSKDGTVYSYDALLSTMPLDELAKRSRLAVPGVKSVGECLRVSDIIVAGFGLSGPRPAQLDDVSWMYFPDSGTGITRITAFSRYSPLNVPDGKDYWSLMVELSFPPGGDLEKIAGGAAGDLLRYGLIEEETQVVSRWVRPVSPAYPVPTLKREEVRPALLSALKARDIYSRGRFGAWMYEVGNMDHCVMQGIEWADHLLKGKEEVTISNPPQVTQSSGSQT